MRIVTSIVAAMAVAATPAHADERADLQAKGEQLAKEGRYGEAIDSFKAADKHQPRASHACLIALAYTRRELWPQAELFLSLCHQRANAGDPLPDWVPLADQQIKERLAAANVAEVTIEVKPATANAQVTVSSFAPDEVFAPRKIYLPPGTHVIFARAEGYPDAQQTIEIKAKEPQVVVVDMEAKPAQPMPVDPGPPPPKRGTPLLTGGLIAAGLGVGAHLWMGFEHRKLEDAETQADYDAHEGRYDIARITTVALYAGAVGFIVTGLVLRSTSPERATVSAVPLEGGAMVSIGWQR